MQSSNNESNQKKIVEASLSAIRKRYNIEECENNSENGIVVTAKQYLQGLRLYGGKFLNTQATIDVVLTSLAALNCTTTEIATCLGMTRKRIARAKERRKEFDLLVQNEATKLKSNSKIKKRISAESNIIKRSDCLSSSSSDDIQSEISHDFDEMSDNTMFSQDTTTRQKNNQVKKTNIFNDNLNYKKRQIREDKVNLEIVRDFCHATCRMDTFNSSQKIQVHNYDGSFEYHPVHIRNQSLKEYYKIFEKSEMYAV